MYHDLPRSASFWLFLLAVDEDLAEETRKKGCRCGGRLHRQTLPGSPEAPASRLTEFQSQRLSFCCDRDGCRKRATPPSVRSWAERFTSPPSSSWSAPCGRVSLRGGPVNSPNASVPTKAQSSAGRPSRREHLPQTSFWKVARARFVTLGEIVSLPFGEPGVRRGLRFPPLRFLIEVVSIEGMPGRLRIEYPGAIYHIMARGNGRQHIVCDDHNRQRLMDELARCVNRTSWQVFSFGGDLGSDVVCGFLRCDF